MLSADDTGRQKVKLFFNGPFFIQKLFKLFGYVIVHMTGAVFIQRQENITTANDDT